MYIKNILILGKGSTDNAILLIILNQKKKNVEAFLPMKQNCFSCQWSKNVPNQSKGIWNKTALG